VGTEWRVNFFRMDQPNGRPQSGTGWSPPMVGDFHSLDKFGVLVFGDDKGRAPNASATPPKGEEKKGETPAKKAESATPEKKSEKATGEKAPKSGEKAATTNNVKAAAKQAFNPKNAE
jgi:hypothetical protein